MFELSIFPLMPTFALLIKERETKKVKAYLKLLSSDQNIDRVCNFTKIQKKIVYVRGYLKGGYSIFPKIELFYLSSRGVTLAQLVKLLSCDYKITGSSRGNSLLCKNKVRLCTIHQMVGLLPGPRVCGSFSAPDCPFPLELFEFKNQNSR